MKKCDFIIIFLIFNQLFWGCKQRELEIGKPAPEFNSTTIGGGNLTLSNLHGTYILLYFWATDCESCRAEHSALMDVYQQFQDASFENGQDFNIVGIALHSNESNYRQIIREDKLRIIHHILDNSPTKNAFDAPLATLYKIKQIPARILLDGNGTILGVNLTLEELKQLLQRKLL
ncbi:MAG: TlpA disulfide reductase family protein [Saprospiraceae bacterium]|nr:TlpA disulfide reductase family protein [Saprospiraceae bacterium]